MATHEKLNAAALRAEISGSLDRICQLRDQAAQSEAMRRYLTAMAKFYDYSIGNQVLIYAFRPDATRVAGFTSWKRFNRYVKKGEKGIPILAPCFSKKQEEAGEVIQRYFKTAYVFDISQTDGEPLPTIDWKSLERSGELEAALLKFAESKSITVKREKIRREAQGYSSHGSITLAEEAGTKTLIHELAHELMHWAGEKLPSEIREIEAESVAYVVSTHFGLPAAGAPNYIATWSSDAAEIKARFGRIREAATTIINAVEKELTSNENR